MSEDFLKSMFEYWKNTGKIIERIEKDNNELLQDLQLMIDAQEDSEFKAFLIALNKQYGIK